MERRRDPLQKTCAILHSTMRLRGQNEITTVDLPEQLEFRVLRRPGWVETALEIGSLIAICGIAWKWQNLWAWIAGGAGILALVASWLQGRETQLSVTKRGLIATGNLGRLVRTKLTVDAADVKSLEYFAGDEGDLGGLFVIKGWTRICLLPGLSETEANRIVGAIIAKFPEIGGDSEPHSLLYGERSDPVTLGLSAKSHR